MLSPVSVLATPRLNGKTTPVVLTCLLHSELLCPGMRNNRLVLESVNDHTVEDTIRKPACGTCQRTRSVLWTFLLAIDNPHFRFVGMSAAGLPLRGICWECTGLHQTQASVEPSESSYEGT